MLGSFIPPSNIKPFRIPPPFNPPQPAQSVASSHSHPVMRSSPTSNYHLTCLCGAVSEPGTLLESPTLPVLTENCHCTDCSYSTGGLGGAFPRLRNAPSEAALRNCVKYDSSSTHRRYHCGTCGCGTFVERRGEWFALGGIIERKPDSGLEDGVKDVVRVKIHYWIKTTVDGGLVPRMLSLGSGAEQRQCELRETSLESTKMSAKEVKDLEKQSLEKGKDKPSRDEQLVLKCHCGGVDLRIKRADYANDRQGVPDRYIPPDKEKYTAYFCVCRSCRLQTGFSLQPWCFVPPDNITVAATGKHIILGKAATTPGANEGTTLKHFNSSDNIYRSFCGTCGASVFYRADEPDHAVVDISVGVLRAEEGMMARRWLDWAWGRISQRHEATDNEIVNAVVGEDPIDV